MIRLFRKTYSDKYPWVATELLTEDAHSWMYTAGVGMPPYEGSTRSFRLMEEDNIGVKFTLSEPMKIGVGDFFVDEVFGVFEITEAVKPTYDKATAGYAYDIKAEAQYRVWGNRIARMCYPLQDGTYFRGEANFSLTDTILSHANIIISNAHAVEARYIASLGADGVPMMKDYEVEIRINDGTEKEMKLISYDGLTLLEALNSIAETWECEWWFEGNVLCFGHCEVEVNEENRPQWVLGDTMESMEQDKVETKFANRLFVRGGTQNIPASYRKTATFTIKRSWTWLGQDGSEEGEIRYHFYELDKPVRPEYFRSEQKNVYRATNVTEVIESNGGILPLISFRPKNCGTYYVRLTNIRLTVMRGVNYEVDEEATGTLELVHKDMASASPSYVRVGSAVGLSGINQLDGREITSSYGNSIYTNYVSLRVTLDDETDLRAIRVNADAVVVESPSFARDIRVGNIPVSCNPLRAAIGTDQYTAIAVYEGNKSYVEDWVAGKAITINTEYINTNTIPTSYFDSSEKSSEVSDYVDYSQSEVRLRLPQSHGTDYVDAVDGLNEWEVVEDEVSYDDIFPRQKDWTIGVPIELENDPAGAIVTEYSTGETTTKYLPVYLVRHSAFEGLNDGDAIDTSNPYVFREDYLLQGEELHVKFEVGARLGGMSFAAVFNPDRRPIKNNDGTYNAGAQWFKLIPNEEYGRRLPDEVGKPITGDPFILTGFNSEAITGLGMVAEAEAELLTKAKEEVAKRYKNEGTSTCNLMSDYVASQGGGTFITADGFILVSSDGLVLQPKNLAGDITTIPFKEGMQVRIFNPSVFDADGYVGRVIGYDMKLDIPWDSPAFIVGESLPYSRLKSVERKAQKR